MKKPDFTLAQLIATGIAGVPILANLAFAFGAYKVSPEQVDALQQTMTWGGVIAVGLFGGDAVIRFGRSRILQQPPQTIIAAPVETPAHDAPAPPPEPGEVLRPGDDVTAQEPGIGEVPSESPSPADDPDRVSPPGGE